MRGLWLTGIVALVLVTAGAALAQLPAAPPPLMPRGLIAAKPGTSDGYVLFSPILSGTTYLIRPSWGFMPPTQPQIGQNATSRTLPKPRFSALP